MISPKISLRMSTGPALRAAGGSRRHVGCADGSVYGAASISDFSSRELRRRCLAAFGDRNLRRDGWARLAAYWDKLLVTDARVRLVSE